MPSKLEAIPQGCRMRCSRPRVVFVVLVAFVLTGCVLMRYSATQGHLRYFKHSLEHIIRNSSAFLEDADAQNQPEEDAFPLFTTIEEETFPPTEVPTMSPEEVILKEQARRHQILEEACRRLNISDSSPVDYSHMLVNDAHRILFNFIPKVSCKSWKGLWAALRRHNTTGAATLRQYSAEEKRARLASYRKVLFVREPLSRVLSAYMSKFRGGVLYGHASLQRTWEDVFGRDIAQRYRDPNAQKEEWLNITLREFMTYITDLGSGIRMTPLNDHWLPQHIVSQPCQINYDFIGHFENLSIEAPYVLRWLGIDQLVAFPEYQSSNAVQNLVEYYKQVPLDIIQKLSQYYKEDYKLFGYSLDDTINRVTRGVFQDDNAW